MRRFRIYRNKDMDITRSMLIDSVSPLSAKMQYLKVLELPYGVYLELVAVDADAPKMAKLAESEVEDDLRTRFSRTAQ